MRIMAGIETEFDGEAWAADGARVGYLPQEPELDPDRDVMGNVMQGVAETARLLERFNEVSARFAGELSPEEMDALIEEQGELQERIDAANGWELERTVEIAMDALRCPPGDADTATLSGGERRRVALAGCCSPGPTCCCWTSRPPSGCGERRLAGALPGALRGHGGGRHP